MKIIQISTSVDNGSITGIMNGISKCASTKGHQWYIAYGRGEKRSAGQYYKFGKKRSVILHILRTFITGKTGFSSKADTKRLLKWISKIKPDIIHLHNLHGYYINIEMLFAFIEKKSIPVVWTLHDCWAYTGHCAYYDMAECDKWQTGCKQCPVHRKAYPYAILRDNSAQNFRLKKSIFTSLNQIHIITPSRWLANEAEKSFLNKYRIDVIPNGIDTELFRILKKDSLRSQYQIPQDKIVILGAAYCWEARKGLDYLLQLATELPQEYVIVLVGLSDKKISEIEKKYHGKIIGLKRTRNKKEMAEIFNCADLFCNPTLEDNFPTTNLEALACGIPVFTFATGGSAESITSLCGKVIERGDYNQLKDSILNYKITDYSPLNCRKRAMEFCEKKQLEKYIVLYEKIRQEGM